MKPATLKPASPRPSIYNIDPRGLKRRAADLEGMTSVRLVDLFSDCPDPLKAQSPEEIRSVIRQLTLEALKRVDLQKIRPDDSVNILASHHGFSIYGGEFYAEMIRVIRDEVSRRTGAQNISLCAGVGLRFRESDEYIERFGLGGYFGGKASGIAPVDRGSYGSHYSGP